MDDKNRQNAANGDDPFKPQLHNPPGTKVIQPSAALLDELKKNQKLESLPKPQQANKPLSIQNTEPVSTHKPVLQSSIYPEATKDVDVSEQITHPAGIQDKSRGKILISPKRIFVIRIVTGFLLLLELISLNVQLSIVHVVHTGVNVAGVLVTLVIISLLIGVLFLKEVTRAIYIFAASTSLVIALFGLLTLYAATHKSNVDDSKSQQLSRQEIDTSINATEQNNQYTQEQKDLIIKNLKDQPGYSPGNNFKLTTKRYVTDAYIMLISIGATVFYTRPKIKEAFS